MRIRGGMIVVAITKESPYLKYGGKYDVHRRNRGMVYVSTLPIRSYKTDGWYPENYFRPLSKANIWKGGKRKGLDK